MDERRYLRVGIAGVGNIGSIHAAQIRKGGIEGMRLCALCDTDPEKREKLSAQYPDVPVYGSADDMLKEASIDAVIIATPHYFHPVIAEKAIAKGIHVLSEKPAAVRVSDALRVAQAADRKGVKYSVMFNQRTNALFRKAKETVADGTLGQLKRSVWIITNWYRTQAYYDSGSWRATWNGEGGGVMLNQAPHNIDLWQWICGMPSEIRAVCGEGKYHNITVEDEATVFAAYPNGATGVFITSTGDAPGTNRLEITGDRGKIVLENGKMTLILLSRSEREFCFESREHAGIPGTTVYEFTEKELSESGVKDGHSLILENFAASVLNGEKLISPGSEAVNELSVSNAAFLSSWTGRPVRLPFDKEDMECFDVLLSRKCEEERAGTVIRGGDPLSGSGNGAPFAERPGTDEYIGRWQTQW